MQLKAILNRVEKQRSFVYVSARFIERSDLAIEVDVRPRVNSRPRCSGCGRIRPGYDTLPTRRFEFVPLWGIAVFLVYAMRRVDCTVCGVRSEVVPWASGKNHLTDTYAWFLARWAKRLSWQEVAEVFHTSWPKVFRSVKMAVEWGRAHQCLEACEDTYYPVIFTAVSTGIRFGRVRTLKWVEVRLKEKCIALSDTKNRKDLSVPMTQELVEFLKKFKASDHPANGHCFGSDFCFVNPRTGQPWVDLRGPFQKALKAAGITRHFLLKNLRHTMASNLRDQGVDLDTIGELLGHTTRDMVLRYAVAPPKRLREAMELLPFRGRKSESQKSHTK